MNVGISAPPAGIAPNGNPNAAPRGHGRHDRAQSDRLIQARPTGTTSGAPCRSRDATCSLAGRPYVGVQTGTLGRSVRAKVPVRDARGEVIGVVSVGTMEQRVNAQLWRNLPLFAGFLALAALAGVAGSLLVARRVKRQTFGLEPPAIGRLFEQREAMLRGIREGVVVLDLDERIGLVNDEARRLLDLPGDCVGRQVPALRLRPRIVDVLTGRASERDEVVLRRGRLLALNWMPVLLRDGG